MREARFEAHRLLAEVYQLLNDYAPVWYSADLRDRLQAALIPPEGKTGLMRAEGDSDERHR